MHSLIFLLNGPKSGKGGKHAVKRLEVDEYLKMQKEASAKVDHTFKEFLAFLDVF